MTLVERLTTEADGLTDGVFKTLFLESASRISNLEARLAMCQQNAMFSHREGEKP